MSDEIQPADRPTRAPSRDSLRQREQQQSQDTSQSFGAPRPNEVIDDDYIYRYRIPNLHNIFFTINLSRSYTNCRSEWTAYLLGTLAADLELPGRSVCRAGRIQQQKIIFELSSRVVTCERDELVRHRSRVAQYLTRIGLKREFAQAPYNPQGVHVDELLAEKWSLIPWSREKRPPSDVERQVKKREAKEHVMIEHALWEHANEPWRAQALRSEELRRIEQERQRSGDQRWQQSWGEYLRGQRRDPQV
ncbi:MAG: hypothetical protein Q9162_002473 [Coniocarpon cinnabarinum]